MKRRQMPSARALACLLCLLAGAAVEAGAELRAQALLDPLGSSSSSTTTTTTAVATSSSSSFTLAAAVVRRLLQFQFVTPISTSFPSSPSLTAISAGRPATSSRPSTSPSPSTAGTAIAGVGGSGSGGDSSGGSGGGGGGGLSTVQVVVLSVGSTLLAVIALVGGIYLCHTYYCRHKDSYLSRAVQAVAQATGLWPRSARVAQQPSAGAASAEMTAAATSSRRGGRRADGAGATAGDGTMVGGGDTEAATGPVWMTAHVGGDGRSPENAGDVEAAADAVVGVPMSAFGDAATAAGLSTAVVIGVPVAVPAGPGMLAGGSEAGGGFGRSDGEDGTHVVSPHEQQAAATLTISPVTAAPRPMSPAAVAVARRAGAVSPAAAASLHRDGSMEASGDAASAVSATFSASVSTASAASSDEQPSAPPHPPQSPTSPSSSSVCAVRPLPPSFYGPARPRASLAATAAAALPVAGSRRRCLSAVPPLHLGQAHAHDTPAPVAATAATADELLLLVESAGLEPSVPMMMMSPRASPSAAHTTTPHIRTTSPGGSDATSGAVQAEPAVLAAAAARYPGIPEEGCDSSSSSSSRRDSSHGGARDVGEDEEAVEGRVGTLWGCGGVTGSAGHRSIGGSTVVIGACSTRTPSLNSTAVVSVSRRA
ncbi:hypothetical protein HYH02_009871 [Chlamydomonas schloesseri]|uniref:Membrane-associated protein n=1 Tax=Chlamydomonas schloesseri TaxID=2026947 RepID=A0A835TN98_9CHLO|nr:hypothetical protein HYH02_009871 [Chlamydomonas schloesseri]|eukprot:KAG2442080.1 hypothetical protein HYH02_009871 [Chlamydomonas schloesseri]